MRHKKAGFCGYLRGWRGVADRLPFAGVETPAISPARLGSRR
jgi:hypothetical protein